MKRFIAIIAAAAMLILSVPAFAKDDIRVTVDGKEVTFDVPPMIENGRTLVPLRAIFEALGASVEYDDLSRTVSAKKDGTSISLVIDSSIMYVDGSAVVLDVPSRIEEGRTLVPVRAVSEAFECSVDWNEAERLVIIESKKIPQRPHLLLSDAVANLAYGTAKSNFEKKLLDRLSNDNKSLRDMLINTPADFTAEIEKLWNEAIDEGWEYVQQSGINTVRDKGLYNLSPEKCYAAETLKVRSHRAFMISFAEPAANQDLLNIIIIDNGSSLKGYTLTVMKMPGSESMYIFGNIGTMNFLNPTLIGNDRKAFIDEAANWALGEEEPEQTEINNQTEIETESETEQPVLDKEQLKAAVRKKFIQNLMSMQNSEGFDEDADVFMTRIDYGQWQNAVYNVLKEKLNKGTMSDDEFLHVITDKEEEYELRAYQNYDYKIVSVDGREAVLIEMFDEKRKIVLVNYEDNLLFCFYMTENADATADVSAIGKNVSQSVLKLGTVQSFDDDEAMTELIAAFIASLEA